jgi:CheY-like chemotaxis protein
METVVCTPPAGDPTRQHVDRRCVLSAKKQTVVLIVDDEKLWRDAMSLLLEPHGITPMLLESTEEAILYLERNPVDILVTDTNMRGLSGIYLLEHVRKTNKRMPIIVFFSGLIGSDLSVEDILDKGATAVLEKGEAMVRLVNLLILTHGNE